MTWSISRTSATIVAATMLVFVLACAPESTLEPARPDQPNTATGPQLAGGVTPMCQQGCVDTDPNPEAPGVFLGSGVNDEVCFGTAQTDNDGDGLSTFCEKSLAVAFAPELWYASNDNVGREPHWVARPISTGTAIVRIMYLLSYYDDGGTTLPPCSVSAPCYSHYGDSESIALDVYYETESQHWVLDKAWYSAHDDFLAYSRGADAYPGQLTYPSHPGGYPRSWVAFGKHANYASQAECDSGGTLGYDHCTLANTADRVAAGQNLNLGSRSVHTSAQDCMSSSNPLYKFNGVQECYWTYRRFSGWVGMTPDASAYSLHLSAMGF